MYNFCWFPENALIPAESGGLLQSHISSWGYQEHLAQPKWHNRSGWYAGTTSGTARCFSYAM